LVSEIEQELTEETESFFSSPVAPFPPVKSFEIVSRFGFRTAAFAIGYGEPRKATEKTELRFEKQSRDGTNRR
jgi:hypothetical protein